MGASSRHQEFYDYWYNSSHTLDPKTPPYKQSLGGPKARLPVHPLGVSGNELVITESYNKMYYRLLYLRKTGTPGSGAVITGQPGIGAYSTTKSPPHATTHRCICCSGKTLFLNYLLTRLVSANQAVLLSTAPTLYLFFRGTVYRQDGVDF